MKTGYKMSLAFIALLLIMGMSASASHMGMSRHASVADSDSAKLEAVNDSQSIDPGSIVDEVIWVVGDEAILKSDVEVTRLQSEADGIKFVGDPDCSIPEQIAVQKLFLHQAAIDSIEVSESEVMQGIDDQINYWVSMIGSREKLEEYRKQSITQMRQQMHDDFKNRQLIQKMKQELVKDIKVSPAQVRKYFNNLPTDSIPFVPTEVEVEINLTDPKKISKIVESEFGYHIIQLIDKRGDKIKCRHILLKPKVSQEAIDKSIGRLDSIGNDIRAKKFTFEAAVEALSDDKDTRNNKGLMANTAQADNRTSKFQMKDLPTEVARVVDTMKVGQISAPFTMVNSKGKTTCALIKLVSRVEGHRATITEDFQVMKDVVLAKEREKTLHDWVVDKIKKTYVRMNDRYKNCNFEYQGWVK